MSAINPYVAVLCMLLFAAFVGGVMLLLGTFFGPQRPNPIKDKPFECGKEPFDIPRRPLAVKFYLVGVLFILFDIELIFLFPWAAVFSKFAAHGAGVFMLAEMLVFLVILMLGYVYLWKRGALEWE